MEPAEPLLKRAFVLGQEYWNYGLEKNDWPDTKIDIGLRMDQEVTIVPAGSFDCMKVTTTLVIHPPSPYAGTGTETNWYAKNIGLVKRIQDDGTLWELRRCENYTP